MLKIKLKKIDADKLREAIRIAYQGDEDMRRIHILGPDATLEQMVDYTWDQSTGDADKVNTKFYAILLPDGTTIGHTTVVHHAKLLFTFGINIAYRNKDVSLAWLKAVERHLGYNFVLTLRPQNERAINFFTRN